MADDNRRASAQLFVTATIAWFEDLFLVVFNRLNRAIQDDKNPDRRIVWRSDDVTDARGRLVPVAAERLWRWDKLHPRQVFKKGFEPKYIPAEQNDLGTRPANLARYVAKGKKPDVKTIFVSTTRDYKGLRMKQKGVTNFHWKITRWTPKSRKNIFQYEIFAYGGIDVNETLGKHEWWNQMEIAFPGGIRPEFVRSAREYDEDGKVIRIWINTNFDLSANGPDHTPRSRVLPDPIYAKYLDVRYWPRPPPENLEESDTPDDDETERYDPPPSTSNQGDRYNPPKPPDRELRSTDIQREIIREPGDLVDSDEYWDISPPFINEDAPVEGNTYAISILNTPMVMTCDDGFIVAEVWQDKDTQKFTCTERGGYLGFVCSSAQEHGGGYLARRWDGVLTCTTDSQHVTEHVSPRADPEGGFTLWMNHGDSCKGFVAQEDSSASSPKFKVMDPDDSNKTATRFGFTDLQDDTDNTTVDCYWGFPRPAGTDCPTEGHTYAIQIYGTSTTFTCVDKTQMRLYVYDGSESQQFVCTLYDGNMGFRCKGGFKMYLGFGSYEILNCTAAKQRDWEHIEVRADPRGGFMLWMKKDEHLAPIARRGAQMMMLAESSTRVSFKRLD